MDKAKAAITEFMSRSGHHDTTVHEAVAPAVHHEVVKPHVHEEVNTAIDKEVHQDHYHRTIQPVYDREVLPETHTAKLGAVQHREFDHRDADATKRALVQDQARFADERRVEETTHSQSVAPTIGGEHVHHHIHETIQPVVQKETIQPNVVHTTVPIHEVHHNKATHHETTSLPTMTMEQFKATGGSLHGREERYDEFEGAPKSIGGAGILASTEGLVHKKHHDHTAARHGDYETRNPLDRNNDGKVDMHDLSSKNRSHEYGTAGAVGTAGVVGAAGAHKTSNPLDRNNDGKVDMHDMAKNRPTDQAMVGSTGAYKTSNPLDRNNDGKVDAHDMTKNGSVSSSSSAGRNSDLIDPSRNKHEGATGTKESHGKAHGVSDEGNLDHRPNEDGHLPKALIEPVSKAIPHSQAAEEELKELPRNKGQH
ncbi:uncharacterized protein SETTUDRAFT_23420 [Exserohilum turcica Et28A]|uniref:Allergen n=1 Tax=Exserohilum turcicum (strain 28A) TaxID=671987 RepID=R0JLS6_EXST2|nr:uncharacterized protein SETTUDRAFT_23420 [Exserohilum turcica Et28A]EOA82178.1 hypothetical protein SETTUDRAFT_23420 [Exserohilum turcica Et28A]